MRLALTVLFSIFAMFSLSGSVSEKEEATRKNLAYCFITIIIAIVVINIY